MEITVLGSGGAFRVPHLSCHCPTCEAARYDPQLRRTTTSLWLHGRASILLDAGPDLYQQALREGIDRIDAIFITHAHRDHMLGIECLEPIVRIGQAHQPVRIFGPEDLVRAVQGQFGYMLELGFIEVRPLAPGAPCQYAGYRLTPFLVDHNRVVTTFGYRVEDGVNSIVYLPDIKGLPGGQPLATAPLPPAMAGADLLFIDATFDDNGWKGAGHITWQQAVALGERSGAGRTVLVHFGHGVDLSAIRQRAGNHLVEGYDGQRFSL